MNLNIEGKEAEENEMPHPHPTHSNDISGEGSLVYFPNNVTVKRINGENFEVFLRQLCLTNIPNHIEGSVKIKGVRVRQRSTDQNFNSFFSECSIWWIFFYW